MNKDTEKASNAKRCYGLGFISDKDLFDHVHATISKLQMSMDLAKFEKNLIDPIKMTIELHAYQMTPESAVDREIARQLGKKVESAIGWFHQNIFRYIAGWEVPRDGVDVMNSAGTVFCEMKNKFNTMNSNSAEKVFEKLKGIVVGNPHATAYLVEVIAKRSQDCEWKVSGQTLTASKAARLRQISIDKFYALATGRACAFRDLCAVLGLVVDDVLEAYPAAKFNNSVLAELQARCPDIIRGMFLSTFSTYEGFGDFNERKT